jgi:hypothetical protein
MTDGTTRNQTKGPGSICQETVTPERSDTRKKGDITMTDITMTGIMMTDATMTDVTMTDIVVAHPQTVGMTDAVKIDLIVLVKERQPCSSVAWQTRVFMG